MTQQRSTAGARYQLEAMIADLSVGVLTLEPDGELRYANRAALQMHGVADLSGLGGTSAGYQQRFLLGDLQDVPLLPAAYPLERLLGGDTFTDLNVKLTMGGDTFVHTCRGIRVADEGGETDFYALFLDDETERFDAEERFERTFAANPAPALINRLSDLRFIKVNQGFLEMTGFRREEVIGRTAYEFDVLAGVEGRESALRRFHGAEVIPPTESYLDTRTGGKRFVVLGGQPLEVNDEPCMLLTFIDLDERKRVEEALRQSEERFSKAFTLAPVAGVISALDDARIFNVNDAFVKLTGYRAGEAVGRTALELGLWTGEGHRVIADLLKTRRGFQDLELKLHTRAGEVCDVTLSAAAVSINDRACVLCMFHDVTVWKRTETELIEAINLAMKDPSWFSASVAKRLRSVRGDAPTAEVNAKLSRLTAREQQVLELLCEGLSGPELAKAVGVSKNTVRNHVSGLYKKLGVHSRAELIVWARRHGVVV